MTIRLGLVYIFILKSYYVVRTPILIEEKPLRIWYRRLANEPQITLRTSQEIQYLGLASELQITLETTPQDTIIATPTGNGTREFSLFANVYIFLHLSWITQI